MSTPPDSLPDVPLRELRLELAGRAISLLVLKDPWMLVELKREGPDEDIYWSELWPSALALSEAILKGDVVLRENIDRVLEVGCGTGLVSIALALKFPHIRIVATDREAQALTLAMANARRNGVAAQFETAQLDWRKPAAEKFKLIVAADCLYMPTAGKELSAFIQTALDPSHNARALVVDPDRWSARNFNLEAREAGFEVNVWKRPVPLISEHGPLRDDGAAPTDRGTVETIFYELRR